MTFNIAPFNFYPSTLDTWTVADTSFPETQAEGVLKNDVAQEAYRLVDDIVSNDKDYRLLVTADYTFGTDYYEKLLREQGYFLPGGPQLKGGGAFVVAPNPVPSAAPVHIISFEDFAPIPIQAVESVDGHHADDETTMADLVAIGQINPKLHEGILNMPEFLSQYQPAASATALGMRTMSDRYFTRLMCGTPASFIPSSSEATLQAAYVPNVQGALGGPNPHLDPTKGCFQCHINLDPLASALSANFSTDVTSYAMGELRVMGGGDYYQGAVYGIRGGGPPATGAFLGNVMHGLADVSNTLANSTEFNSCVIQKAMEEIYGRDPVFADLKDFNAVLDNFMKTHSYNQMIIDLVSMPTFIKGE